MLALVLTHPNYLDDPRTALTIYLPPIATLMCCCIVGYDSRFLNRALVVAGLAALPVIAPLRQWLNAPSGVTYPLHQLFEVLFAASFPFLAIFIYRRVRKTKA